MIVFPPDRILQVVEAPPGLSELWAWDTSDPLRGLGTQGRVGAYTIPIAPDVQPLVGVRTCGPVDRVAIYWWGLRDNSAAGGAPPELELELLLGMDLLLTSVVVLAWSPAAYGGGDFLVQLCGRLFNTVAVRARATSNVAPATPVGVNLRFVLDRARCCEATVQVQVGPLVEVYE